MSVGQTLRRAREAQARSLEQVHSRTRISVKLLQAIETDDLSSISSAFQYRSFVRQIAAALELDYTHLQTAVQANAEQFPPPLMPGENVPAAIFKLPALAVGKRRSFRWVQSLASLTAALVVCSAVYAFWQSEKAHGQRAKPEVSSTSSAQVSAGSAPGKAAFTVELSATEPAWLSIVTDGRESFKGILERAQTKMLAGRQSARIRTGNAGALEAVFNGKPIGTLGQPGQARTVVFTRNNYRVLDAPVKVSWWKPTAGWNTTASGVLNPLPLPALLPFPASAVPHS